MIQANELRIGNLIADHEAGRCFQIESIYKNMKGVYWVSYRNESIKCSIDELEPIPLTEEWLVKLGFEKIGYEWKLKQGWHWISVDKNSFYILGKQLGLLEHVHQLQNLYFAITGEELTIKN